LTIDRALIEVMTRDRVLVGTDFDGVLAPLVETPDLAVPDQRAVALLAELSRLDGVRVAVISGRDRADVALRLGEIPGVILVGEHGNDWGQGVEASSVLADARAFARELQASIAPATIEEKPHSVSFHTRRLDSARALAARGALESWVDGREGIVLIEGKEVFELTVATRSKGDAISELATGCDAVVFFGDDVTDESVFETLGPSDLGIKVGPGATAARHRVEDVDGVVETLELMVRTAESARRGSSDE